MKLFFSILLIFIFSPQFISCQTLLKAYGDVFLKNNTLYCANGTFGLTIYDISNPSNPVLLSNTYLIDSISKIMVVNNIAYILGYGIVPLYTVYILSVDVTASSAPVLLSSLNISNQNTLIHMAIQDNDLILVNSYLSTYDISNPRNIILINQIILVYTTCVAVVANQDYILVAVAYNIYVYSRNNSALITNIPLPQQPSYDTGVGDINIDSNGFLYVSMIYGITKFDITNIYDPIILNNVTSYYYYDSNSEDYEGPSYYIQNNRPYGFAFLNDDCMYYGQFQAVETVNFGDQYGSPVLEYNAFYAYQVFSGPGVVVTTNQATTSTPSVATVLITAVNDKCPIKPLDPGIIAAIAISPLVLGIVIAACRKAYKVTKFESCKKEE